MLQLRALGDAKQRATVGVWWLYLLASVVTVGGAAGLLVGADRHLVDSLPWFLLVVVGMGLFWVGREVGRIGATLVTPRWWEEINHDDVIWAWGSRVPGQVRGPYCPNHSELLVVCRTGAVPDEAEMISPENPLCCLSGGEKFWAGTTADKPETFGALRARARQMLDRTSLG